MSKPVMMLFPSNLWVQRRFMLRAFTSRISSSGGSGGSGEWQGKGAGVRMAAESLASCQPSAEIKGSVLGGLETQRSIQQLEHGSRRRQWQPTPVLLLGESRGWRSLVGCSPWGHWESDTTEQLLYFFHFHALENEMATHSSILAWRIPGTEELDGVRLWGRTECNTTEAT